MTDSEIISEILRLELEMTRKIIGDRTFRPSENDQFKEHRKKLERFREKLKDHPLIKRVPLEIK